MSNKSDSDINVGNKSEPTKVETQEEATRERFIAAMESIGYKVTNQSPDGSYKLLRLPDGVSTSYWIFEDRIEHRLDNFMGGSYISFKDCHLIQDDDETVAIVLKGLPNHSSFIQFHNFKSHGLNTPGDRKRNELRSCSEQ